MAAGAPAGQPAGVEAGAPYLLGVDGGGSGCRVVLADRHGVALARVSGAAASLALGAPRAWAALDAACRAVFAVALGPHARFEPGECVMAAGLAGANHAQWRADFLAAAPAFSALMLESDALTSVLGAHGGAPGVIVALGTGSIGAARYADGSHRTVGGYGFPAGDEASGAWLGLHAVRHAQHALDGRAGHDAYARALHTALGIDPGAHDAVAALVQWLGSARQADYARLAPVVLAHRTHPAAAASLQRAGEEAGLMIDALDPDGSLPLALTGGLADGLHAYLPDKNKRRLRSPLGDSASGALWLAANGRPRA